MRKLVFAIVLAAISSSAVAQVRVKGYTRRDGTYVAPHYRSTPNRTTSDNWTTRGNVNPYTGQRGTRDPYAPSSSSSPTYRSDSSATDSLFDPQ